MPVQTFRKAVEVVHIVIETSKSFELVQAAIETSVAAIVLKRDNGIAVQYEIGNQRTAAMIRCQPGAANYAPLRAVVCESGAGARIEYDLPSSLLGQFGDERVSEIARSLDLELITALCSAAE